MAETRLKERKTPERSKRHSTPLTIQDIAHQSLLWIGRVVLLAMIAAAPWYYGGANWSPQFYLVQASWGLLAITMLSILVYPAKANDLCGPAIGLLALIGLGLLQVVPLPDSCIDWLDGNVAFERKVHQLALEWDNENETLDAVETARPARGHAISIDRTQSSATVASMVTAVTCLVCATQLFASRLAIISLASVMVAIACGHAFLGLVQTVAWDKWTWLDMPHTSNFSTFVSRNSAPQYYASAIGAALTLLGISIRDQRKNRSSNYQITYPSADILARMRRRMEDVLVELSPMSIAALTAILILSIGVVAANSRGGMIAHVSAGLVVMAIVLGKKAGFLQTILVVAILGSATMVFTSFFDLDDRISNRFESFEEDVIWGGNVRLLLWSLVLQALPTYWLFGSGLGTFHFGILPFHTMEPDMWFYHAESIPMELIFECGISGLVVLIFVMTSIFRRLLRELDRKKHKNSVLVAVVYSLTAIGIQSLVDFSLILPAVFIPLLALLGAFYGESQRLSAERSRGHDRAASSRRSRPTSLPKHVASYAATAVILLLATWSGFDALAGYAASEQFAYRAQLTRTNSEKEKGDNSEQLTPVQIGTEAVSLLERYPRHPEALVQSSRGLQHVCQQRAIEAWDWGDVPLDKRQDFTNPRFVASAVRYPAQVPLDFKQLVEADPVNAKYARKIHEGYLLASQLSPQDWRSAVGVFHSDFAWMKPREQIETAARVYVLAGQRREIAVDIAHLLVLEQKKRPGMEMLKGVVASAPRRLFRTLSSLAYHLPASELMQLLPQNLSARAAACKILAAHPKWREYRATLLPELVKQIERIASPDWDESIEYAWVARESGHYQLEAKLLRIAVTLRATRHDIRFRLAVALMDMGDLKGAHQEIQSCLKDDPKNGEYVAFEKKVAAQLDSDGN